MELSLIIDTAQPLSSKDVQILSFLLKGEAAQEPSVHVQPVEEAKPVAKKAVAKKAAAPEPTPEPEPMAEEPLEDEPEPEEDEADETSDEELLALAVKKATEMVAGGDAAKVREALDAAGASRVRELNKGNVRAFFKALP